MAAASAAEARAALRRLLRAVDRHLTSVAGNTAWRDHVLAAFREPPAAAAAPGAGAGAGAAGEGLQLARDYADLINGVAHHRELLLTYNLGLDPDERNRRMVAATAHRVGFALPNEPPPPPRLRGKAAAEAAAAAAAEAAAQQGQPGGGGAGGGEKGRDAPAEASRGG